MSQIDAVATDIGMDAIKIGMLGSAETAMAVARYLEKLKIPVVFDPVMVATSGNKLADDDTIEAFSALMKQAWVVTPNLPELDALGGKESVLSNGCHLLMKGGHGAGNMIADYLYSADGLVNKVEAPRIETRHTHGTGCTLATALACGLGAGQDIETAFVKAVQFTRNAIAHAPGLGKGSGPLGQQFVTEFGDHN